MRVVPSRKAILVVFCSVWLLIPSVSPSSDRVFLGFKSSAQWNKWKSISFPNRDQTDYTYDTSTGTVCGHAESSASGRARTFPRSLDRFPVLTWEWNVDGVLDQGNARKKRGDDYSARVYVNFKRTEGQFTWWEQAKAEAFEVLYNNRLPGRSLNFIWANKLDTGTVVPSAYTERARLIPLESGPDRARTWVTERVNILQWYHKVFDDMDPPPVQSVAIMVDSDNTESRTRGCFRNIRLISP